MSANDFNPEEFLKGLRPVRREPNKDSDFDPADFLASISGDVDSAIEATVARNSPHPSPGQTAVDSFGNAALAGYQPQLEGGVRTGMAQFTGAGLPGQPAKPSYVDERDKVAARIAAGAEANPEVAKPAALLGMIANGAATGGLMEGAGLVGQAATVPGRILKAGLVGGTAAGLQNPGDTPGVVDPIQAMPRAKNFARGAALGIGVAGSAEAADKILRPYFNEMANEKAFKATGAYKKDFLRNYGNDRVQGMGQQLRDEGFVRPWTTAKSMEKNLSGAVDKTGAEYGQFINNLGDRPIMDPVATAEELGSKIKVNPYAPGSDAVPSALNNLRTSGSRQPSPTVAGGQLTGSQTQAEKRLIDEGINYNRAMPEMKPAQAGLLDIRNNLRDKIRNGVIESGQDVNAFDQTAQRFGNLAEAQQIAQGRVAGNAANRAMSLSDNIQGAALGHAASKVLGPAGYVVGEAAGGLVNKGARAWGNSIQSNIYGGLEGASGLASAVGSSSMAQGAAGALATKNYGFQPQQVIQKVAGTKYQQMLSGANNDHDFALRYFSLQQSDPEFRKAVSGSGQ